MITERQFAEMLKGNPDLRIEGGANLPPIRDNGDHTTLPPIRQRVSFMSEHDLQAAIIAQCDVRAKQNPRWGKTFAVPNGGQRHVLVAKALKAEGVRAGVSDLFNLTPRHGYHGLVMELKVSPNDVTAAQLQWLQWFADDGYCAAIVRDHIDTAINVFNWYLEGSDECTLPRASSAMPSASAYLTYVVASQEMLYVPRMSDYSAV